MAIQVKDATNTTIYLQATGAGSVGDPAIPTHAVSGSVVLGAGSANVGDVDVLTVPAPLSTTGNGTAATALRVSLASDSTGQVTVASGSPDVTALQIMDDWDESDRAKVNLIVGQAGIAAGAGAVGVTVPRVTHASDDPAVTALQIIDNMISGNEAQVDIVTGPTGSSAIQVQGTVAHDSTAANNPILNGAEALATERAAVSTTDVVKLVADLVGKLIVLPYANPENFLAGKTGSITDTTRTAIIAAQGGSVRIYVTHIIVSNAHATQGTVVKIEDATTEIYNGYAAPAGGGFSITFPVPLRLTANQALNITCVTTGANVYASASGYKGI